jgi:NADPH:quinone reductase-like Zn-dependent oxidoreductase
MLCDSSNHRPDFEALQKQLSRMGADHVLTYDDLLDKNLRTRIKEWTGGKVWNVFLVT